MAVTVGRTVTYGLASLPAVVAFSEAVIDKTYLTWLDVNKLLTAFPQHVKLVGDAVIFQGPVAILSPKSLTSRHFIQCSLAIAIGAVYYIAVDSFIQLGLVVFRRKLSPTYRAFVPKFGALAIGALCYYMAGRYLPTQAGVYFDNRLSFYA